MLTSSQNRQETHLLKIVYEGDMCRPVEFSVVEGSRKGSLLGVGEAGVHGEVRWSLEESGRAMAGGGWWWLERKEENGGLALFKSPRPSLSGLGPCGPHRRLHCPDKHHVSCFALCPAYHAHPRDDYFPKIRRRLSSILRGERWCGRFALHGVNEMQLSCRPSTFNV